MNTINSELNVKAWQIRRNAAKRFSCKVMEISWSECLRMAKQGNIAYLNRITKANTASNAFEELLSVNKSYNPTLFTDDKEDLAILADAFDYYMQCLGRPNRIFRARNGYYKDYIFLNK